jgi:hypothetical protein
VRWPGFFLAAALARAGLAPSYEAAVQWPRNPMFMRVSRGSRHRREASEKHLPLGYAQWPARSDALIAAGVSKGGSAETTHQPRLPLAAPAIVAAMEAAPSLRQITLRRRRDGMSYPLLPPGTLVKPQVRGLNFHWLRVVKDRMRDIAAELNRNAAWLRLARYVCGTVARTARCFIIEGGDNRKINCLGPRARRRRGGRPPGGIATLGPPPRELFLGPVDR